MTATVRILTRLALVGILVVAGGAVAVIVGSREVEEPRLSAFSTNPDDVSMWRDAVQKSGEIQVDASISTPLILRDVVSPTEVAWVVLGAERPYDETEERAIHEFLARGGSLLLADTSGNANRLLSSFEVRIGPSRLLDAASSDNLTRVRAEATVSGRTFPLILRSPGSLLVDDDFLGEVLSRSSDASYLDIDANQRVDEQDVPGPFDLVATSTTAGGGRLVVLSDVGIFLNDGFQDAAARHADFHRSIADLLLPNGGRMIVDEGSHSQPPAIEAVANAHSVTLRAASTIQARVALGALVGILALLPLGVAVQAPWRRHEPDLSPRPIATSAARSVEAARDAALRALSHETGLRVVELTSLPPEELSALCPDDTFRKAVLSPEGLAADEIQHLLGTLKKIEG